MDAALIDAPAAIDAPTDAAIDARPSCPAEYTVVVGAARYSLRAAPAAHDVATADCADDRAGRTHLATFENADLDAVMNLSGLGDTDQAYIGGECNSVGASCDVQSAWFWIASATAVAASLWDLGEPSAGFAHSYVDHGSGAWKINSGGTALRAYLCECDP